MAKIGKAIIRLPRKISKGSVVKVQSILIHPNHTGLVKDKKTKKIIPAHFVESCTVEFAGTKVYDLKTSAAMSKDPYIAYNLKVDKAGDLKMTWKDNKGGVFEKSVKVNPA